MARVNSLNQNDSTGATRRMFCGAALGALATVEEIYAQGRGDEQQSPPKPPYPILDTHIHLFDSLRPQGVPYGAGRPPALPEAYSRYLQNGLREAFGLKGTPLRFSVRNSKNPYAGKKK